MRGNTDASSTGGGSISGGASFAFLATAVAVAFIALAFAPLSQAKNVIGGFGANGTLGGQFTVSAVIGNLTFPTPRGVAINNSGNGAPQGTVYVVDAPGNRIQRFSPSGSFERTWGENVLGRDEKQTISLSGIREGSFTLSYNGNTTAPIDVTVSPSGTITAPGAAAIRTALTAPSIGIGSDVVVIGKEGLFTVRFIGALSGTDVPQLVANISGLSGPAPSVAVATAENGSGGNAGGFEICTVAANCQDGMPVPPTFSTNPLAATTANGGDLKDPQGVAVNQANGHVYVTDQGNRRVQEFDANGIFVRAWGWDVEIGGSTSFEICTVATNCKTAGAAGANGGQFGAAIGYPTTDASNNIWVPDATNRRIQQFSPTGNFIAAYGYNVDAVGGGGALEMCVSPAVGACQAGTSGALPGQFSNNSPGNLAFDSSGNLYAIDSGNKRVQKFDPALTTAAQFGASAFAPYPLAPDRIAATQSGERLAFVVNTGATNTGERHIIELDPTDGSLISGSESLVGAGLTPNQAPGAVEQGTIQGLASNDTTGNLYATVGSPASPRRILTLNANLPNPLSVSVDDVTTVGSTTATFGGRVDLNGGLASCSFEYSTDQVSWTKVATTPDCDSLSPDGGCQPISASATGLQPASQYFVRLAVSRPLVPSSTVLSGVKKFTTNGVPPVVSNVGAVDVRDASARLVGTIDPRNSATGYVFEYGATPALGSTTTPVDIGGGTTPVIVSKVVEGLDPDTTYYFRLSATNLTGTTTSGSKVLKTRNEPIPPQPQRAFEQVTPDALNNVDAGVFEQAMITVARDGQTIGVCNFYPPEGEGLGFCGGDYLSRRTPTGWHAKSFLPPTCRIDPDTGQTGDGVAGGSGVFSENLDLALFMRPEWSACPYSPVTLNPEAQTEVSNFYRGNLVVGTFDLIAPNPAVNGTAEIGAGIPGPDFDASDDFGVVFYQSQTPQTSDAPVGDPPVSSLYEWDHGTLRLASIKPPAEGGAPFTVGVTTAKRSLGGVSDSGSRVFFYSPPLGSPSSLPISKPQLYMREDGTITYDIGQSECTHSCGATSFKLFAGASEDGSMVLFETPQKLSDDDIDNEPSTTNSDLYLYHQTANPGGERNLYVLTRDNEPADGTSAQYRGVIGRSQDGKTVFFVGAGQIVPAAPTADGFKVYRWRWNGGSPTVDFLANLDKAPAGAGGCRESYKVDSNWVDENNWNCESRTSGEHFLQEGWVSRVRADGGQLTIDTIKALDPVADTDSTRDVYTWEEATSWRCVSCQAPGAPSAGVSMAQGALGINGRGYPTQNRLPVAITSSDGKKIFFTSRDQLVPSDTNGTVRDVYEWNDGRVSLISSGISDKDNLLVGTSVSGDDVFFVTSERLVGWDIDNVRDIYDARVDGGFPEPEEKGSTCEGEACHGAGASAPANSAAGTAVFQGPGNSVQFPESRKSCPKGTRRMTVKGKRVCRKPKRHKAKKHRRAASNVRRASR